MKHIKLLRIFTLLLVTAFTFQVKAETVQFGSPLTVMDFLSRHSFKNSDGSVTLQVSQNYIKVNGQPVTGAVIIDAVSPNSASFYATIPVSGITMHYQVYTDGTLYYVEGRETYKANVNNSNNSNNTNSVSQGTGIMGKACQGIPSEASITFFQQYDNHLYASGTKMWREGMQFKSEPVLYQSVDGGMSWTSAQYPSCPLLSTYSFVFFNEKRIIVAGRKGETQVEWIGAICYSDDNGSTWKEASGIPSDVSIVRVTKDGNAIVAYGQKQWKEGYQFLSEPQMYVSRDNGASWVNYMIATSELSTVAACAISSGRTVIAGRLGQAQMVWKGAIFFTDDNGNNWQKSSGIPEDFNIASFLVHNNKIFAFGCKSWQENYVFHSVSKAYVSNDKGKSWEECSCIPSELSNISAAIVFKDHLFTSGRKGDVQVDWVGGVYYSDDF